MEIKPVVVLTKPPKTLPGEFDGIIVLIRTELAKKKGLAASLDFLDAATKRAVLAASERLTFKPAPNETITVDLSPTVRMIVLCVPKIPVMFPLLTKARASFKALDEFKAKRILVDARGLADDKNAEQMCADAMTAAYCAVSYQVPDYKKKDAKKEKKPAPQMSFLGPSGESNGKTAASAGHIGWGTNLVRRLTTMAGNDLTASKYVALAKGMAEEHGLKTEFFSLERLEKMGAGAFMAVAKGSDDKGGGILKVSYAPENGGGKNKKSGGKIPHLVLVGKGITFDTGGFNIKTGSYMYGMNGDMGGSAVALSVALVAARAKWPLRVTAYMAICDNILSPRAYKPNDIVTSLKGIAIEVIDTDAEGRMVLADTLHIAGQEKPDLLIDLATLTGACVRAIGTTYSGAFTNKRRLFKPIIDAGRAAGERLWPFPNDKDFGEPLESDHADIKQCRLTGGVDHIEASYFLRQFVPEKTPWIHIDLAAAEHDDGLAHVPTKVTGFGVRAVAELTRRLLLS